MKLILYYVWKHKRYLPFSLLGVAGFVGIQMGVPTMLKHIINEALLENRPEFLRRTVLFMLGAMLLGCAFEICMSYGNSRIASNAIRDIRNDMFIKTQSFSHYEFNQFTVASLITSATSDAYQILIFIQAMLRSALITPVMTISGIVLILINNPSLFLGICGAVPILLLGIFFISRTSRPFAKRQQTSLDKINLIMREGIEGLRVIRAFRNESFQTERFEEINREYCDVSKKVYRRMALTQPGFYLIFNIMIAIILWVGAKEIGMNKIDVGTLSASIEYIFHVLFSFMIFAVLIIMFPRASVSAKRIERILNSEQRISENLEKGICETELAGKITFEDVTFAFDSNSGEPALTNISFTIERGETVAFIGSTGSGKSTLVQLIPRIYDVSNGNILVNDVDVRNYNIHALRDKIAFIPQTARLFTGTIAENLRVANPNADFDTLKRAAKIAQASNFINRRKDGYNSLLSEGGNNLSGGQKQRLAIARAIVKNPEIYIFDDSFSALDYTTDYKLRAALRSEIKDATVLIVAQRISTIKHADKIFVLNEGRIVGQGTHEQLMDNCGVYYDIAISQLSQEELT